MTLQEKIARLSQLFKQRDEVEAEIETLIGTGAKERIIKTRYKSKIKPEVPEKKIDAKKVGREYGHPKKEFLKDIAAMRKAGDGETFIRKRLGIASNTWYKYYGKVAIEAKEAEEDKPIKAALFEYVCENCEHRFSSEKSFIRNCPNCAGIHVKKVY